MVDGLCVNCFHVKKNGRICPYCGYAEGIGPKEPYHLMPGMRAGNGRYIIGLSIGTGGFGIIYKAYDTILGVVIAVKEYYPAGLVNRAPGTVQVGLLSGEKKETFQKGRERFLAEAKLAGRFQGEDDIIQVYGCFEENGTVYMAMEYIKGKLLKDLMRKRGYFEPKEAVAVALHITEAVKKLHEQGVIHRDISPDNIFCSSQSIKLFDLGAAQLMGKSKEDDVPEAVIKPGYTPPEQYRKKGKQGFYTDIYSIGALLYEMLTGVRPVEATQRAVKDILKRPGELGIQLEPNLERTVMKAMALDPGYRFQNAEIMQKALYNKLAVEFPETEQKRKRRKRNFTAACAFLLVVGVACGIGFFMSRPGPFNVNLEQDTLTVWIPVEKEPESGIVRLNKENADRQDFAEQWEDHEQQYRFYDAAQAACIFLEDKEFPDNGNIEVELVPVLEQEYEEAFEEAVTGDVEDGYSQPVLFLTDSLGEVSSDHYASLQPLYASLELEDYYFLPEYRELFADASWMPTGFDMLFLYWRETVNRKDTQLALPKDASVADLVTDILEPAEKGEKKLEDLVGWDARCFADTLYLLDPSMLRTEKVVFSEKQISYAKLMYQMQHTVEEKYGDMDQWFDSYQSDLAGIISDSTLLSSSTITASKGNYEVRPLSCNGKTLAVCRDVYAVNVHAEKNKQNAAMRLLAYLLTQDVQNLNFRQHKRALPLRRDVFKSCIDSGQPLARSLKLLMLDIGTDFDTMLKPWANCQVLYRCGRDLNKNLFGRQDMSEAEIEAYLQGYE